MVNGWKRSHPPFSYEGATSSLTYDYCPDKERAIFDAAQGKLREPRFRDPLLKDGGNGRMNTLFGLTPRDAVKLILTGRF